MTKIRCLDSVEVDATKLAWRIDVAEIRCSDSVEVDAWNFTWRIGVAEVRSLESEAWILWKRMRRSRGLMEGCCRKYGKFTTFERENARQLERNSMKYFFKRLTLRISWTCVVSTEWT